MSKKGFTLIELLAVIILLSIISLIAVPIVLNMIQDSKKNSFEQSIKNIKKAANFYYTNKMLNNGTEYIKFDCNNNKCISGNDILKFVGKVPDGNIIIYKDSIYAIFIDKTYIGVIENDKIIINKINIDNSNLTESLSLKDGRIDGVIPLEDKILTVENDNFVLVEATDKSCFAFDSSTQTITKYYAYQDNDSTKKACPKDLIIPNEIDGVPVKKTGYRAIANGGVAITSVFIPPNVEEIGSGTFRYNNKLTKVILSEGLKIIGSGAFELSKDGLEYGLTQIKIPSTVTIIGDGSFKYQNLTSIDLSECSNLSSVGTFAFASNQINEIKLPQNIDISLTAAFNNNNVIESKAYIYKHTKDGIDYSEIVSYAGSAKDILIPSEKNNVALKTLGNRAFGEIALTNVEIPSTVTVIGFGEFMYNNLTTITIPSSVTIFDSQSLRFNNNIKSVINKSSTKFNWTRILSSGTIGESHDSDNYGASTTTFATGLIKDSSGNIILTVTSE